MDTTTAKRAYRFRFYPTPEQEQTLRRTLGCCRKVYNMALEARSEAWTVRHESVSYEDTSRMLTDWKKTKEYAYLREVSSVPLQQSLRHLQARTGTSSSRRETIHGSNPRRTAEPPPMPHPRSPGIGTNGN